MQPGSWPVSRSTARQRKASSAQLSDDELRKRIFANTAVLFPSSSSPLEGNPYEIVYGSKARDADGDENPWQYAMIVRRNHNGGYTPLIKGQAWATSQPWNYWLCDDATAGNIGRAPSIFSTTDSKENLTWAVAK
ncbi:hypothetical protein Slin14017_G020870 [Septoria linicola]|nr:hypothetical protein Slin14017_G020870 [Septoria linicola]